jgi:hypothetical protein
MDNVQKVNNCINISSSQNLRIYFPPCCVVYNQITCLSEKAYSLGSTYTAFKFFHLYADVLCITHEVLYMITTEMSSQRQSILLHGYAHHIGSTVPGLIVVGLSSL